MSGTVLLADVAPGSVSRHLLRHAPGRLVVVPDRPEAASPLSDRA